MVEVEVPAGGRAPDAEEPQALAGASCPATVRRGSSGSTVSLLQRCLNARGSRLAVDGQFGLLTERAVEKWQVRAGLVCDGVVGPATWRSLDQC